MADETTTTNGSTPPAAPSKPMDLNDIFQEVYKRAELAGPGDVFITKRAWWSNPEGKRVQIVLGQTSPFEAAHAVVGIFYDDDEIRVYTVPSGQSGELERYSLSRQGRNELLDALTLNQFIDALADEFRGRLSMMGLLDDDDEDEEDEEVEVEGVSPTTPSIGG